MDSAKSIEFKFHMDLQKKLREVVADIIRGNRQFKKKIFLQTSPTILNFSTDVRRARRRPSRFPTIFLIFLQTQLDRPSLPLCVCHRQFLISYRCNYRSSVAFADNFFNFLQTQLDRHRFVISYVTMIFCLFLFTIDSNKKTLVLCVTEDVGECVVRNIVDVIGVPVTR